MQNYDPFGQIEAGSTLIGPFGYTGELQDAITGQEYLRARWYQPGSGTLLGVDLLVNLTDTPYAYVFDDPLNATDPMGLCPSWLPCPVLNALGATKDRAGNTGEQIGSAVSSGYNDFSQGVGQWQDITTQALGQVLPIVGRSFFHPTVSNVATALLVSDVTPVISPGQAVKTILPAVADVGCGQYGEAGGYLTASIVSALLLAPLGTDEEIAAAEDGGSAMAYGTARSRWAYQPTVTGDFTLAPGEGETDPFGNIRYSTQGTQADQSLALYHESVHSFFSPRLGPFRELRARLNASAYNKSSLLRYVEEALAESYAQLRVNGPIALPKGIAFPITNGYVTLSRTITEAAIGSAAIGGVLYAVYVTPLPGR